MPSRISCYPLLVVVCLIVSVYIFKIGDLINVEYVEGIGNSYNSENEQNEKKTLSLDDSFEHLMWFVQISDLHLSVFSDHSRVEQLKEFCSVNIPTIQPQVVLASGDLTDGKTSDAIGSRQFEEEWRIYKDTILRTGVLGITKWLDIRGNHDNFDVVSINSSQNYFRKYSVQGSSHPRSYIYHHLDGYDRYSFIGVDACLEPGPRRPFNFIGLLDEKEMQVLEKFEYESRSSNATIWFGHYPTSSMFSPYPGIRHLMRNGHAYLCGHFHTFYGFVPHMYTLQKSGLLELELGDWKDSRLYRVAAIDHNVLSFVDIKYSEWPVILITNPKHALLMNPGREPVEEIVRSTHIRILVFSPRKIAHVYVRIDKKDWERCDHIKGPLYVHHWSPDSVFDKGIHMITVKVEEVDGTVKTISQPFSLDGTQISFDFFSRVLLMGFLPVVAQILLALSVCFSVLPLCWIRLMHYNIQAGKLARPRYTLSFINSFMRKMWLVATIDRIFYPLVIMALYVPLGPWFIGYILSDRIGVCFAWGMFVDGAFLPGGITFAHAVIHMWIFNIPLIFLLGKYLDFRYCHLVTSYVHTSFFSYVVHHLSIVIFLLLNGFVTALAIPAYGIMAFLLNPFQTWSFLIAVLLWKCTASMPDSHFRHLCSIFPIPGQATHRGELVTTSQQGNTIYIRKQTSSSE